MRSCRPTGAAHLPRITTVTPLAAHCHARQITQSQSYGIKKEESTEIKSVLSSHFSRECSAERPAGRSGGVARGGIRNPLRVSCTPFCKEPAAGRQHSPAAGWRHVPARRSVRNPRRRRRQKGPCPPRAQSPGPGIGGYLAFCVKAAGTADPFPLNLGEVGDRLSRGASCRGSPAE